MTSASAVLFLVVACGDDGVPTPDAAVDSATVDTAPVDSGSLVSPVAAPALPDFSACPPGWLRVPSDALEGLFVCEPFPGTGPAECAGHEAHFVGEPDCARIGTACPTDGWPADLPASGVIFVRAGTTTGGDGSRALPVATISEGVALVVDGGTVAIGVGEYPERVEVRRSMRLVGACPEGVVLSRPGTAGLAIIDVGDASSVEIRNLTTRSTKADHIVSRNSDVTIVSTVFDGTGIVHANGNLVVEELSLGDYADTISAPLSASGRGDVRAVRVAIRRALSFGATFTPEGTVHVEDFSVIDTGEVGLQLGGSEVTLRRVVVDGALETGISVGGPGASEDVVVRRVRRGRDGISVGHFSPYARTTDRLRIEDAGDVSVLFAVGESVVRDLVIVGSDASIALTYGRGVEVAAGAHLSLERAAVVSVSELGILVDGAGTSASLSDLTIEEVRPGSADNFGRCVHVQVGAEVDVTRAVVRRCSEAAMTASHAGSLVLRDVRVEDTLALECELGCDPPPGGVGLVALEMNGRIDAERFVIERSALAGVQIVEGGELDLRDGTIAENPVGVNVQVEGYDLSRVMSRVVFRDNGVNLDTNELPVPSPMVAATGP